MIILALSIAFSVLSIGYFGLLLWFRSGFEHITNNSNAAFDTGQLTETMITVIIPSRNEENSIDALLTDLAKQSASNNCFEVIVVNDHSDDRTMEILTHFDANYRLSIYDLPVGKTGKKQAIQEAIQHAQGEWILQTDGDCRVGPDWIKTFIQYIQQNPKVHFVSGPVRFIEESGGFKKLQQLEFMALIGIGAASIEKEFPNMANAANMAYSKTIFLEVKGYEGNTHLASGDDEFLLSKIQQQFPGSIGFLKRKEAIVETESKNSLSEFLSQRIRWAGKWNAHGWRFSALMPVFLFLYYACIIGMSISVFFDYRVSIIFGLGIALKYIFEVFFYRPILRFFNRQHLINWLVILQFIYPLYTVVMGALSFRKTYTWKGRKLS